MRLPKRHKRDWDGKAQNGNEEPQAGEEARTDEKPKAAWHVTMRPWLFCILFLALFEGTAHLAFDHTLCLRGERLDNFPGPAALNTFTSQIAHDPALRIVMIGDSTLVGGSKLSKNQTVPAYLEAELHRRLPGRSLHVWNLGLAAARATDMRMVLRKALEAKPDLVIAQGNVFLTGMRLEQRPVSHPWLARCLREVQPDIRPLLPSRERKQVWEDALVDGIEKTVRLVGMRHALTAKVLGPQPRVEPFDAPNPLVSAIVEAGRRTGRVQNRTWRDSGFSPNPGPSYSADFVRDFPEGNINLIHGRRLAAELQASGVPAFTYLTPQNPAITRSVAHSRYYVNRATLRAALSVTSVACYDFSDQIPEEFFADNDHMLAEGNRRLAAELARLCIPLLAKRIL